VPDETGDAIGSQVCRQVERIGDDYLALAHLRVNGLPLTQFDPQWPSVCVVESHGHDQCRWRPVRMPRPPAFSRLADALEVPILPALRAFFSVRWSAALPVTFLDNDLDLLQLWSEQDFEHLVANLIGHALEKRRIRQPLTLFFALVDDDRLLSVDNDTGAVFLETLGQRHPLEVCASLPEFLAQLQVRWPETPGSSH